MCFFAKREKDYTTVLGCIHRISGEVPKCPSSVVVRSFKLWENGLFLSSLISMVLTLSHQWLNSWIILLNLSFVLHKQCQKLILFCLISEFYQCKHRHWIWMLKCDNWFWHLRFPLLGPFWNNFRHCALVEEYQIPCCPTNSELKYQQKQSAKLRLKNIAALLFLQLILVTNIWTGQHFSNQGILTLSAVAYRW